MKNSSELVKRAGITPRIKLGVKAEKEGKNGKMIKTVVSTGPHRVKLIDDKIIRGTDHESGTEIELVRYTVEENGEKKFYDTRLRDKNTGGLSYLVQRLAEFPEGAEVILEMKRKGIRNYVEVSPAVETKKVEVDDTHEDVEAVEETDPNTSTN